MTYIIIFASDDVGDEIAANTTVVVAVPAVVVTAVPAVAATAAVVSVSGGVMDDCTEESRLVLLVLWDSTLTLTLRKEGNYSMFSLPRYFLQLTRVHPWF